MHSPRFGLKLIGFALLVLACAGSLPAQITSSADFAAPVGGSYVIGLMGREYFYSQVLLVTSAEVYTAPLPLVASGFNKILNAGDFVENIKEPSSAAVDPLHPQEITYTSITQFQASITTVEAESPNTVNIYPIGGTREGKITYDSDGSLYYFTPETGFLKYANSSYETPLLTFGLSGLGQISTMSYGLSIAENVVFALDSGAGRVVRFNATTGDFLSDFTVTGAREASEIAVSTTGRLYLTDGNGGGTIYDAATGTILDTFASTGVNAYANGGRDSLFLDDDAAGQIYLFDAATGLHVFNDPAVVPEPSTYALVIAALLSGLILLRRRKAMHG